MNNLKSIIAITLVFALITACNAQKNSTESVLPPEGLLTTNFNTPSQTTGEELFLYGQVLGIDGQAIEDAIVEIWQTDADGVYDHLRDPSTAERDVSFQFYGSSQTNASGWYVFRTILPGKYEPRPRHIHFKVKLNDDTVLTSQFYFSEDTVELQNEGMFRAISDNSDALLLQLVKTDIEDSSLLIANGQIVVAATGRSGSLKLTPSQAEGPYYPVVSVVDFDNDLTVLD